jgi:hypothetical protein
MKKTGLIFLSLLMITASALRAEYTKGNQYNIAKKYADNDEAPVVMFEPDSGAAMGFVMYAHMDNDPEEVIIIPYRIRKSDVEVDTRASIAPQILSVDVVRKGKKIRGFLEIDLAYTRAPKPCLTVRKLAENEFPKLFLLVDDGFEKGWDKNYVLLFNSFDPKDRDRKKEFNTVKLAWDLILKQFGGPPTINEFRTKLEENYGQFYVRLLDKDAKWPKITEEQVEQFKKELQKAKPDIYWEYGYKTQEEMKLEKPGADDSMEEPSDDEAAPETATAKGKE